MVIGGSQADPGLGRPQPAAAAQRLRPRASTWTVQPRTAADARGRAGHLLPARRHHWSPALPEREALGADGGRVRRRIREGRAAAHRRRRRAAGAGGARSGQPRASADDGHGSVVAGDAAAWTESPSWRRALMSALQGASVLVTGGAGTIGSTIVDQLLDAGVAAHRRPRQPGPRPAGQPRRGAGQPAGSTWSRATSATATWSTT